MEDIDVMLIKFTHLIKKNGWIPFVHLFLFILMIFFCLCSGCTSWTNNENNTLDKGTVTPDELTNTYDKKLDETVAPEKSTGESKSLKETFRGYSEYILELFPDFIPKTVENTIPWEGADATFPNKTIYTYEHIKTKSSSTVYTARINAETGKIRTVYRSSGFVYPDGSVNITFDDAESIAKTFITKALGESPGNLFPAIISSGYTENLTELKQKGKAPEILVHYLITHNELPCHAATLLVFIDSITGKVVECHFTIPDLQNLTFASEVPDVTFDEAKKIVESQINEEYPGEAQNLDITCKDKTGGIYKEEKSGTADPFWDTGMPVYSDNTLPVRLIWFLEMESKTGNVGDNSYYNSYSIVDAHTGEVLRLSYKGIQIDYLKKYFQ
ncbi:hypothetical protein F1737_05845 [Methanoplanus sp. FWC-SCC4]|uniref:Uncharacterized protein n=1 Tax=Methanochimaera problematica TaxID=2609417 RepID=A0AA97FF31_9EURY|nr:hypothetical protein [Methanoplanus sp. FWC-SCC4]WOF16266.1 hypothetical protein F1737_05845 [Methanoplanus sp. FWC-SCC4]